MNRYNLTKDIVQSIVNRVNQSATPDTSSNSKHLSDYDNQHLLVVFTGSNFRLAETLRNLSRARKQGFSFDIAFSFSGAHIIGEKGIEDITRVLKPTNVYTEEDQVIFQEVMRSVDGIIVPMATQDITAKLALGIQDNFISTLLWQSLWHGKKVFMDFCSVNTFDGIPSKTPALVDIMNNYISTLERMGVVNLQNSNDYKIDLISEFNNASITIEDSQVVQVQASSTVKNMPKIVTVKDLLDNVNSNNEVVVPIKTIITPLALDTAKKQGIKVIRN